jgi:hypothetical protein
LDLTQQQAIQVNYKEGIAKNLESSDTERNSFAVESGYRIFTSGPEKPPMEDPVFLRKVDGEVRPVILRFTTPWRLLRMAVLAVVALFLPVIVALFLNGFDFYGDFKITDDLPVMAVVNDGKPCWILDGGAGLLLPIFSGYRLQFQNPHMVMQQSLDFGVPRQMDIPGIVYDPDSTIFARAWRAYLSDRYDVNTKVMTCRVDFSGIKVSQDLLRRFYWYDNSLWVLNAIRNYSLTTFDPVECEFIQVQSKPNYLEGQFIIENPV